MRMSGLVPIVLAGISARLILLLYGEWQDRNMMVKYTDVDYDVFSDAARIVYQTGGSPYERSTYRYTPLLAWILTPNVFVASFFGKVLFVVCDVVVAALIYKTVALDGSKPNTAVAVWLLNPFVANVSTRGNAESFVVLWVILALYLLRSRRQLWSALALGIAIHVKIYPVIYLPSIMLSPYLDSARSRLEPRVRYAAVVAVVVAALAAAGYALYGWDFVYETYLYHVVRSDHRHNFSLYFYSLYLGSYFSLLAFIPQAVVLLGVSVVWARHNVFFCWFALTVLFVAFNKVCTVQYFVWYFALLPFVAPSVPLSRSLPLAAAWLAAQAAWLGCAYLLEFRGLSVFPLLWLASLAFFASHIAVLVVFAKFVHTH